MSHIALLLSCVAYAGCALLLAALHRRMAGSNRPLREDTPVEQNTPALEMDQAPSSNLGTRYAAGIFALAAFYALPPGSVPPLLAAPWGGTFFFCCLLLSFFCGAGLNPRKAAGAGVFSLFRIAVIFAILALYVFIRGIPGSALNLGTYVAMPLWQAAGWAGKTAVALLCCGFILELVRFPAGERHLQRLALVCLLVVLFLPWTFAAVLRPVGPLILIADFFAFWGKALAVVWLMGKAGDRARRLPSSWVFIFAGALLLAVDRW